MSFNLFGWIRDGVKQSVLLGVSDAIETIGMPPEREQVKSGMLDLLGGDDEPSGKPKRLSGGTNPTQRKRLGRSLKEIEDNGDKK